MARTEQLEPLAERLIVAVSKLGREAQRIGLPLIRKLAERRPVADHAVAVASAPRSPPFATRLSVGLVCSANDDGLVVGFMGLSVVEFGEHRIEFEGRRLTVWCAWDTLFLPGLLGRAARVSSRCPVTGETISLTVASDGPSGLSPAASVLSLLAPVLPFDADVVRSFCHFVHFFASARAADEWVAQHPGTFVLSIEDAFELGRLTNATIFGAALHGAESAA